MAGPISPPCWQADDWIIGDRRDGLKGQVAGSLDGPLVVLLEQDRANQSGDGGLAGVPPLDSETPDCD